MVELTQTRVHEAVPHAPGVSDQPAPLGAGREAERGPQHTDQQVAGGDAHQEEVHGRAQRPVPAEEQEHQEVSEEAEGADEAEADGHQQVPGGAQGTGHLLGRCSSGTVRAAQAHVGNDHAVKFGAALGSHRRTEPSVNPRGGAAPRHRARTCCRGAPTLRSVTGGRGERDGTGCRWSWS